MGYLVAAGFLCMGPFFNEERAKYGAGFFSRRGGKNEAGI